MADEYIDAPMRGGRIRVPASIGPGRQSDDIVVRIDGSRVEVSFITLDPTATGDVKGEVTARVWMSLDYFLGMIEELGKGAQELKRQMGEAPGAG